MATATSPVRLLGGEPTTGQRRRQKRGRDAPEPTPDRAMRGAVTALLAVIGIVQLHLWLNGYGNTPTIGSLFLVAVTTAGLLAIAVTVRLNAASALASASFAAGTPGSKCPESSASEWCVPLQGSGRFLLQSVRHRIGGRGGGARRCLDVPTLAAS
jgi:hypothetical protein